MAAERVTRQLRFDTSSEKAVVASAPVDLVRSPGRSPACPPVLPVPAGAAFRPPSVRAAVHAVPGVELPAAVRFQFETAFGTDLSGVRIHTGEAGDQLAQDRGAAAVTVGGDIHFRAGAFRPGTPQGDRLLAHELTHVVQQGGGPEPSLAAGGPAGSASGRPGLADASERQAVRVGRSFATGGGVESAVRGRPAAPAGSLGTTGEVGLEQYGDEEDQPADPTKAAIETAAAELRLGIQFILVPGLHRDGFDVGEPLDELIKQAPSFQDTGARERAGDVVDEIAGIEHEVALPPPVGTVRCTLAGILRRLALLHAQPGGSGGYDSSAGVRHAVRTVAEHMARALASAVPDDVTRTADEIVRLETDLDQIAAALRDGTQLLRLELEGVIAELVQLRHDFTWSDDEEARALIGDDIGRHARQALLLNSRLSEAAPAGAPTALDTALQDRAAEIKQLQIVAGTEEATRRRLGDRVTLLGAQQAGITPSGSPGPLSGNSDDADTQIEPGEAFPVATDTAERTMAGELSDRIRAQRAEVTRLRAQLVPEHPTYQLDEFAAVHRRWFGMYSAAQEQHDPSVKLILELLGEPYKLMGTDVGSTAIAVEGGFARAFLMRFGVDRITGSMTSFGTEQFAGQVAAAGLTRKTQVTGTAGQLRYRYGEIYTGAGSFDPNQAGEVSSRTALSDARTSGTAQAATAVAAIPDALADQRPAVARKLGLVTGGGDVPLVGLRAVNAREGWTYLTDVNDPVAGLVSREQKTMPPEVVQYLLAAQQQTATLASSHVPQSGWTPLGSAATRISGVEKAPATAQERYLHGALSPRSPAEVNAMTAQVAAAQNETGVRPGQRPPGNEVLIAALRGDLQAYLDRFFVEHQDVAWRLSAIFTLANTEHHIGDTLMALLEPKALAQMIAEAIKITAVMMTLQALGPLGQIAARAYGSYLASQGVSNVAALISVAGFCHEAADADSLARARAWGYMSRNVANDAADLFSDLVTTAVTTGMHAMVQHGQRPNTPRELADALQPLLADPVAREKMLAEVNARIAEHEKLAPDRSDPDLEALRGFRDSLEGVSRPESGTASEAPLIGKKDAAIDRAESLTDRRTRSETESQALRESLPAELARVPIIESSEAGNAVRVRYGDEGGLRLEVGRDAGPEHIRRHEQTVRELRRYEGVMGRIQILISRVWQAISGTPGYGTQGFESKIEVRKLTSILTELTARQQAIEARATRLIGDEHADLARERRETDRDVAAIERQLKNHEKTVDSLAAGRGFVAAESTMTPAGARRQASETLQLLADHNDVLDLDPGFRTRFKEAAEAALTDPRASARLAKELADDVSARLGENVENVSGLRDLIAARGTERTSASDYAAGTSRGPANVRGVAAGPAETHHLATQFGERARDIFVEAFGTDTIVVGGKRKHPIHHPINLMYEFAEHREFPGWWNERGRYVFTGHNPQYHSWVADNLRRALDRPGLTPDQRFREFVRMTDRLQRVVRQYPHVLEFGLRATDPAGRVYPVVPERYWILDPGSGAQ